MVDFLGLMKQATQLQSKMADMQAELDALTVEGTAGGGLVNVTLSAKGDLRNLSVDPSLLKPEEKQVLEDLVVTAHAEARRKAEDLMKEKMQTLTGGLPMPPGLTF
jgi:DNA-binding YbaB/EbfC family protein